MLSALPGELRYRGSLGFRWTGCVSDPPRDAVQRQLTFLSDWFTPPTGPPEEGDFSSRAGNESVCVIAQDGGCHMLGRFGVEGVRDITATARSPTPSQWPDRAEEASATGKDPGLPARFDRLSLLRTALSLLRQT